MPFYASLKKEKVAVRRRAAKGLLALRTALESEVPKRTSSDTLLLATWNIREFDTEKYGPRCVESFLYIAEIVSHFDIVAVQEESDELEALDRLQEILGGWWKYILTDVTIGKRGNRERLAFLYDSRKVTFGGLAGEIVLPPERDRDALQFARTPFLCGFRAGWSKFNLCTVHILYGSGDAENPERVAEIRNLAQLLARRAKEPAAQPARPQGRVSAVRNTEPENLILLGDFNIFGRDDTTMTALTDAGFLIPEPLLPLPGSNLKRDKHYDQIAFRERPSRFEATGHAGVFDFGPHVFTDDAEADFAELMGKGYADKPDAARRRRYFRDWRSFQMSDHLALWMEFRIDFAREYLMELGGSAEPPDEPPV